MSKHVLVMFGGVSPEHEVSVITGLQVVENIDRSQYEPIAVYITKRGELLHLPNLKTRKDFSSVSRKTVAFGADAQGGYMQVAGLTGSKYYPYAAYLAFHGGNGESGPVQGLMEALNIPTTCVSTEGAVITMNKKLTKDMVAQAGIESAPGINLFATEIKTDAESAARNVLRELALPLIIKPVHLGSSIGIKVAHTEVELQKALLEAAHVDSEVLVEKFLTGFTEYNCAVRLIDGNLQASEVERPLSKDEILSFADKYQRGGKKTGGSGMASLQRELPAKIASELKSQIQESAKRAFVACRCKGMVRIDFMHTAEGKLYLTEINPIPGSMAFYLWEATGVPFTQQITDMVEQAVRDNATKQGTRLDYETDIIEKFVAGN